ncbi:hypothetical protein B1R94_14970 [Mycolicibacterium litorale]|nr:hypothetical protein B1R94_14970 [Mycolicibacterium litorale]
MLRVTFVPGDPGTEAGGTVTPFVPGIPGEPGALAGGMRTLPGAVAGGTGPPTVGGLLVKIEVTLPGSPGVKLGGLDATVCRMSAHGTPGLLKSAAARGLNSGAVQKNPAVAMAVTAATREVVRDIVSPFL